jgi:hypothetical protein
VSDIAGAVDTTEVSGIRGRTTLASAGSTPGVPASAAGAAGALGTDGAAGGIAGDATDSGGVRATAAAIREPIVRAFKF